MLPQITYLKYVRCPLIKSLPIIGGGVGQKEGGQALFIMDQSNSSPFKSRHLIQDVRF